MGEHRAGSNTGQARVRRPARRRLTPRLWLALSAVLAAIACNYPGRAAFTETAQVPTEGAVTAAPETANAETTSPPQPSATLPVATSTSIPSISYTPTFEASTCRFFPPQGFAPECGYLTVPENRTNPGTRMIRLHVAIFRARGPNPAPDPVIHVSGGPGSASTDIIWYHFQQGEGRILERRDYIFFDQRGTGHSEPSLACPEADDAAARILTQAISIEEGNQIGIEAMAQCRARLAAEGIDLAAYHSAATAADINDLRTVLGYDQINLYGVSYGTRVALTAMRETPEHLRSVILDSVYPPQEDLYLSWARNAQRGFNAFFEACALDAECGAAYPDLEATFYQLVDDLNATPVTVPVTNPATGREIEVVLNGERLISVAFSALYRPDVYVRLPRLITDVRRGYYSEFLEERLARMFDRTTSRGFQASVQCYEEIPFSSEAALLEAGEGVVPQIAYPFTVGLAWFYPVCETWGVNPPDARENEAVTSTIPTLILAGHLDPITPPEWGQRTAEGISPSYFYELPNAGHWVMRADPCAVTIMLDFLDDPSSAPDASCLAGVQGPDFVP